MGQDTAEKLQQSLREAIKRGTNVGIEKLLEEVAIENGASLQAVAVELFDLLQWGELKLTGADITKGEKVRGQQDPQLRYMDKDRRAARNKRDRAERDAGGVRRSESRIDRDRILQSWAFRRLEGVTQIVPPDNEVVGQRQGRAARLRAGC